MPGPSALTRLRSPVRLGRPRSQLRPCRTAVACADQGRRRLELHSVHRSCSLKDNSSRIPSVWSAIRKLSRNGLRGDLSPQRIPRTGLLARFVGKSVLAHNFRVARNPGRNEDGNSGVECNRLFATVSSYARLRSYRLSSDTEKFSLFLAMILIGHRSAKGPFWSPTRIDTAVEKVTL